MNVARFEKVSENQFLRDLKDLGHEANLQDVVLPKRATRGSAGYDFSIPFSLTLEPGKTVRIPTGIRCYIEEGYVLHLYPRSSLGFKYGVMLTNTVGIIDADYYGAKNEGHIIVSLTNTGSKTLVLNKGDRFVQGIFLPFFTAEEEEVDTVRTGGFGSSNTCS